MAEKKNGDILYADDFNGKQDKFCTVVGSDVPTLPGIKMIKLTDVGYIDSTGVYKKASEISPDPYAFVIDATSFSSRVGIIGNVFSIGEGITNAPLFNIGLSIQKTDESSKEDRVMFSLLSRNKNTKKKFVFIKQDSSSNYNVILSGIDTSDGDYDAVNNLRLKYISGQYGYSFGSSAQISLNNVKDENDRIITQVKGYKVSQFAGGGNVYELSGTVSITGTDTLSRYIVLDLSNSQTKINEILYSIIAPKSSTDNITTFVNNYEIVDNYKIKLYYNQTNTETTENKISYIVRFR